MFLIILILIIIVIVVIVKVSKKDERDFYTHNYTKTNLHISSFNFLSNMQLPTAVENKQSVLYEILKNDNSIQLIFFDDIVGELKVTTEDNEFENGYKGMDILYSITYAVLDDYIVINIREVKIDEEKERNKTQEQLNENLNKFKYIDEEKEQLKQELELLNKNNIIFDDFLAGASFKQKEIKRCLNYYEDELENNFEKYSNNDIKESMFYIEKIFQYDCNKSFGIVKLEKEPNNEYDKNAIKVLMQLDEEYVHLGYIPAKKTKLFNNLNLDELNCVAFIYGGKFKEAIIDENDKIKIVKDEFDYKIRLTIKK